MQSIDCTPVETKFWKEVKQRIQLKFHRIMNTRYLNNKRDDDKFI